MTHSAASDGRRVLLVLNPNAGSASALLQDEIAATLAPLGEVVSLTPPSDRYAAALAEAARAADLLVVAGGDGSLNWAVNALADQLDRLTFALIPMGTGNDLARTLGIPLGADKAAEALIDAAEVELRLGVVSSPRGDDRLFVNACVGGFPVAVGQALDARTKELLGPLAFWLGGAKALPNLRRARVSVNGETIDDCVVVGVAVGRSAGGGFRLWPHAQLDDDVLDVCALPVDGVVSAAALLSRVLSGTHAGADGALYTQVNAAKIDAEPAVKFNVDGELVDLQTPLHFTLGPKLRLRVPRTHDHSPRK